MQLKEELVKQHNQDSDDSHVGSVNIYNQDSDDLSAGDVSIAMRTVYTFTLSVCGLISSCATVIFYGLYTQKEKEKYRVIYEACFLLLVALVIAICLLYFWEYLFEPIYPKMFANLSKEKLPVKRSKGSVCRKICTQINKIKFDQNAISSYMCIVHQIYSAILIWAVVIHGNLNKSYIITGLVKFFEAFSITLPGFALITYCEGYDEVESKSKRDQNSSRASAVSAWDTRSKPLASHQSIFRRKDVIVTLLLSLIIQFIIFVTYPSLNHDTFKSLTFKMYDCDSTQDCSSNPFFLINALILRLFIGMTLLDAIFLVVANLLGDVMDHSSIKHISKVLNPCIWVITAIVALCEINVLYTKDNERFEDSVNIIWVIIHGITFFMASCCIFKLKNVYSQKLEQDVTRFYSMNVSLLKTSVFFEAMIIWMVYLIYFIFLLLSDDSEIQCSIIRQGSVFVFLSTEAMVIYNFKQCQNHPNYRKYFVLYNTKKQKRINYIDWTLVLQWIAVLNFYDLVSSFIFETSHFMELFKNSSNDASDILFQMAFSLSFSSSHFNFWCLSMVTGILYHHYFNELNDRMVGDEAKFSDVAGGIGSVKRYPSIQNGSIASVQKRNNTINRQKFSSKKRKNSAASRAYDEDDNDGIDDDGSVHYDQYAHMMSNSNHDD